MTRAEGQTYLRGVHGAFDIVAKGAAVTGAVGDTVRVTVGLRNKGPGVPDGSISGESVGAFVFVPPAGVTVLATPPGCWLSGDEEEPETVPATWYCNGPGSVFPAGTTHTVAFDLRIDSLSGAPGDGPAVPALSAGGRQPEQRHRPGDRELTNPPERRGPVT